jgi:hypothetical protein
MTAVATQTTGILSRQTRSNKPSAERVLAELRQMSKASFDHDGLLNHAQAALILDVSRRRVAELVELGKLTRLNFLGRTYVSVREVMARRDADVKAGRPKRTMGQRLKYAGKAFAKYDLVNLAVSAATPERKKERRKRK